LVAASKKTVYEARDHFIFKVQSYWNAVNFREVGYRGGYSCLRRGQRLIVLISHKHKFIFIHVWKVAGMSIQSAFRNHAFQPHRFLPYRVLRKLGIQATLPLKKHTIFDEHITAAELKQQLPDSWFDQYFKFAFVRNPWDLEVSLYHFAIKHRLLRDSFSRFNDFDEYLQWRVSVRGRLQKDFLTDGDGEFLVDFIGRFENLTDDFAQVCQTLHLNEKLPLVNSSSHRDYRSYYTDRTRELLAETVREDIEMFGYEFDGSTADVHANRGPSALVISVPPKIKTVNACDRHTDPKKWSA
jgi:hypothetical protein